MGNDGKRPARVRHPGRARRLWRRLRLARVAIFLAVLGYALAVAGLARFLPEDMGAQGRWQDMSAPRGRSTRTGLD